MFKIFASKVSLPWTFQKLFENVFEVTPLRKLLKSRILFPPRGGGGQTFGQICNTEYRFEKSVPVLETSQGILYKSDSKWTILQKYVQSSDVSVLTVETRTM